METTNPRKAGALIINNLSMFNEAAILLEQQIEVKVFEIIEEIINDWIKENGWEGSAEWLNPHLTKEALNLTFLRFLSRKNSMISREIHDICFCSAIIF